MTEFSCEDYGIHMVCDRLLPTRIEPRQTKGLDKFFAQISADGIEYRNAMNMFLISSHDKLLGWEYEKRILVIVSYYRGAARTDYRDCDNIYVKRLVDVFVSPGCLIPDDSSAFLGQLITSVDDKRVNNNKWLLEHEYQELSQKNHTEAFLVKEEYLAVIFGGQ